MPTYTLTVTTTGGNGAATGSTTLGPPVRGFIDAITVTYHASTPNTTDLVITEVGGAGQTILTLTNVNTSQTDYPLRAVHDTTGAAISGQYDRIFVDGQLKVDVAQSNALSPAVTVKITVIEHVNQF